MPENPEFSGVFEVSRYEIFIWLTRGCNKVSVIGLIVLAVTLLFLSLSLQPSRNRFAM